VNKIPPPKKLIEMRLHREETLLIDHKDPVRLLSGPNLAITSLLSTCPSGGAPKPNQGEMGPSK
jgi:hypothetical protein